MAIKFPKSIQADIVPNVDPGPIEVTLPRKEVLDAGMAEFERLAKQFWPSRESGFKLTAFDVKNEGQIRMTLGLVFMKMMQRACEIEGKGGTAQ